MHPSAPLALALALAALPSCREEAPQAAYDAPAALAEHSQEFEPELIQVTERVHVAVGYGLANSILIEGDDGVIVVDTLESVEAAERVKELFDGVTTKPVRAIVYTHNHADHIFGARAFVSAGGIPVYAHESTNRYIDRIANVIRPVIYRRSMRMFGNLLPAEAVLNAGIGPFLATGHGGGTPGLIRPDRTFADRLELAIAGVRLELVHAPGETPDQLFVWLPEERVLLPGDNFYRSFPNLYTIRGTLYRDVLDWVASLDAMRERRPLHLVPSHTRPLHGEEVVLAALTDYRDAIQYVHDQTVRGMNRGLGPDELVASVELPPHLAASPYLQEFYGTVEWSVRSIFAGYLGWFDGNAAHLSPRPRRAQAERMAELAGGPGALRERAGRALAEGQLQWAAELADHLVTLDPGDREARRLGATALRGLGEAHRSANGRHYYLTQALEMTGELQIEGDGRGSASAELLHSLPLRGFFSAMSVSLDPEASRDVDRVVGFRFPDAGEDWTVHVRRGVAEIRPGLPEKPEILVTLAATVWKEMLAGLRSPALTLASGEIRVEGGRLDLIGFLRLFEP